MGEGGGGGVVWNEGPVRVSGGGSLESAPSRSDLLLLLFLCRAFWRLGYGAL